MTDSAAKAWDRELTTLRGVVGAEYNPEGIEQDQRRFDIEQIAKGVLLIATLPPEAFGLALKHLRLDIQRRNADQLPHLIRSNPEAPILTLVLDELEQAAEKHGEQMHLPVCYEPGRAMAWKAMGRQLEELARRHLAEAPDWLAIVMEEVGEMLQAERMDHLRTEAIQVAAMATRFARRIQARLDEDVARTARQDASDAPPAPPPETNEHGRAVRVTAFRPGSDRPLAEWETREDGTHQVWPPRPDTVSIPDQPSDHLWRVWDSSRGGASFTRDDPPPFDEGDTHYTLDVGGQTFELTREEMTSLHLVLEREIRRP